MGIFSRLDLNGMSSPRAQPKVGAWGPQLVPSTRTKVFWRWFIYVLCALMCAVVIGFGWYVYRQLVG